MRSPKNSIASIVRNIGAVNEIAVKSASGINVSAVNQQNMLAVPDNDRSACERRFLVLSTCSPSTRHATTASTTTEITPRTKIVSPLGMASPRCFTHAPMLARNSTDASLRDAPRTGR